MPGSADGSPADDGDADSGTGVIVGKPSIPQPEPAPSPWRDLIFVCTKCMRRQDREDLRDDLRQALKKRGCRELRVVATGCLDLCPKDGVTLALGHELGLQPPRLRVIGNDADIDDVARWLAARAAA